MTGEIYRLISRDNAHTLPDNANTPLVTGELFLPVGVVVPEGITTAEQATVQGYDETRRPLEVPLTHLPDIRPFATDSYDTAERPSGLVVAIHHSKLLPGNKARTPETNLRLLSIIDEAHATDKFPATRFHWGVHRGHLGEVKAVYMEALLAGTCALTGGEVKFAPQEDRTAPSALRNFPFYALQQLPTTA